MNKEFILEQFTGPLDLLLSLLQEKKMSISEVALSQVTEQYLAHVDTLEQTKPEELADFLVIASRLLLLKARALLPQLAPDEDDGDDLEKQLRLYKRFVEASKQLNTRWLDETSRSVCRTEPPRKAPGFVWPENVSTTAMQRSMESLIHRLKPIKQLPTIQVDRAITIKERINDIRARLKRAAQVDFFSLIDSRANTTDVIVSFLALLELAKQRVLTAHQDDAFADIVIHRA